eukprot:COSAG02_NODE_1766_length_11005_cov_6.485329_1_plen_176_part_10
MMMPALRRRWLLLLLLPLVDGEWEAVILEGAGTSSQPQGNLALPFFWPFNTQRKVVKVQCVYTAADLRAAGVQVDRPIEGVGIMVGRAETEWSSGATINGLRIAFRWTTDTDLQQGLTVWGTKTTTFRFIASGGTLISGKSISTADLRAGQRQRLQFDPHATELKWDGIRNLLLEV